MFSYTKHENLHNPYDEWFGRIFVFLGDFEKIITFFIMLVRHVLPFSV